MSTLSDKAKSFIRQQATHNPTGGGLMELSTLQIYTLISTEFTPTERKEIFETLRRAFYINFVVIWKLNALWGERLFIQNQFKEICDKWEWVENILDAYNKNPIPDLNGSLNYLSSIDLLKKFTNEIAPLTVYKGGRAKITNRPLQRTFEKLRNKHKYRLNYQYITALLLEEYIEENDLTEYITDEIKNAMWHFRSDIAHAPKYSRVEFENTYYGQPDTPQKKQALKYVVYPSVVDMESLVDDFMITNSKYFLFNDLEAIEKWQMEQWGI